MRRYKFLDSNSVYSALNKLRASFLAAHDGNEVEEIIKAILTHDEMMKIGRRIQIAEMIQQKILYRQIAKKLKVGISTVLFVAGKLDKHPLGYKLITNREEKVKREYKTKSYESIGGSKLIFKKKVYTGFTKKDVQR